MGIIANIKSQKELLPGNYSNSVILILEKRMATTKCYKDVHLL